MVAKNEKSQHRELRGVDLPGTCKMVMIWCTEIEPKEPIGHVILLYTDSLRNNREYRTAYILDIWVQPKYRRDRFATHLLAGLQSMYDEISTDWRSETALKLCLKCGFRTRKTLGARLIWRKGTKNGTTREAHSDNQQSPKGSHGSGVGPETQGKEGPDVIDDNGRPGISST